MPTTLTPPRIVRGSIVLLDPPADYRDAQIWRAFPAEVLGVDEIYANLRPLADRPDGGGRSEFYWSLENLRPASALELFILELFEEVLETEPETEPGAESGDRALDQTGRAIAVDDRVAIAHSTIGDGWIGITGEVQEIRDAGLDDGPEVLIAPETERPWGSGPFWWPTCRVIRLGKSAEPEVVDVATVEGIAALDTGTVLRAGTPIYDSGRGSGELWAVRRDGDALQLVPLERATFPVSASIFLDLFRRAEIVSTPSGL